ncbi:MAG: hypothetical protein P4M12_12670 [Gammaproteobacteria bacterium]|nr:hypothetical protein [Gammaproteobacteria bacterium]
MVPSTLQLVTASLVLGPKGRYASQTAGVIAALENDLHIQASVLQNESDSEIQMLATSVPIPK